MKVNLKVLSAALTVTGQVYVPTSVVQASLSSASSLTSFYSCCHLIIPSEEEGASYYGFDLNFCLLVMLDAILLTIY